MPTYSVNAEPVLDDSPSPLDILWLQYTPRDEGCHLVTHVNCRPGRRRLADILILPRPIEQLDNLDPLEILKLKYRQLTRELDGVDIGQLRILGHGAR